MTWRNLSFLLAALCVIQTWRGCHRRTEVTRTTAADCAPRPSSSSTTTLVRTEQLPSETTPSTPTGISMAGFTVPTWVAWFAPQPGENMLAYRDRLLPIARAAIAPQRARVARGRDDFARLANLDAAQRAQLDASVHEAATAIQDKLLGSFLAGDLSPSTFKPMTGVGLARDVLDTIDQANRRFVATLREDQRTRLAQHPFDFADYMLFSARWEDALGVME